jgi:hypothetical protein
MIIISFDNGDKLDVVCPKFIPEEPVEVERMIGVFRVDRAEDVEFHAILLKKPGSLQDPAKGPMASPVFPIQIMKLLGTIEAQADQKVVLMKELAPLVIKEDAVGLEGVFDACAGLLVPFLKLDRSPEEIEPHEGRLSALPRYRHLRDLVGFEKLPNIGLVDFIRHAKAASRVEFLLFQEEAVFAIEIAGRSRGFGHDMEGLRNSRLRHGISPFG